jgi:hypothetical protein
LAPTCRADAEPAGGGGAAARRSLLIFEFPGERCETVTTSSRTKYMCSRLLVAQPTSDDRLRAFQYLSEMVVDGRAAVVICSTLVDI